jgi:dihydrodipicolinate synthase/N-acetylneuraminate lyase
MFNCLSSLLIQFLLLGIVGSTSAAVGFVPPESAEKMLGAAANGRWVR